MNTLIIKLGATGDVVRTTPIVRKLDGQITWITTSKNVTLLQIARENLRCISWENRNLIPDIEYDLVINLEDTLEVGFFLQTVKSKQRFGAYVGADNALRYTDDSSDWFDLSLISRYGREQADRLKLLNRRTYQDLLFAGLGYQFSGETYLLPAPVETGLSGDVAIAAEAGPVWPMKNWAYYPELKRELESQGLRVNVLDKRASLLEHLADVRNHRCLVGGDSLPMHLALGTGTRCVTIFNCTSPWEIYDYGIQNKIISPLLTDYFYQRGYDRRAITAISTEEVMDAVVGQLKVARPMITQVAAQ
jgi:ADP-heptose:LPS heptosyltransferase